MLLNQENFSNVIQHTPLVSIDLIIENREGHVLLGKRINEPACGYWFVPGGRIFKEESLDDAFLRTTSSELGISIDRKKAKFYGLYEHFYSNNVFNDDFSTHYIVLAHQIKIDELPLVNQQHSEYKWFSIQEILENESVHLYTKDYFTKRGERA